MCMDMRSDLFMYNYTEYLDLLNIDLLLYLTETVTFAAFVMLTRYASFVRPVCPYFLLPSGPLKGE